MKHPPKLREVRARLETAFDLLPDPTDLPEEQMERYESLCVAVLDSEHMEHLPGELESYLRLLLEVRAHELGLADFGET